MKKIIFTVTNDLSFDQRMHRICSTLAANGYEVVLVGRKLRHSLPLKEKAFQQKRLNCLFSTGFLFYAEYNLRLFFYLLQQKMDAVCAIDLDTILPVLFASKWKSVIRVYDAHELFTEMKEVRTRPAIHRFWLGVEKYAAPHFRQGYTVGNAIAKEFEKRYGVQYAVVRNMPLLKEQVQQPTQDFILYQGAVNEARGLEYLIPAMKLLPYRLVICGDGNFMDQLKALIAEHKLEDRIELRGMVPPDELQQITGAAMLGINLVEKDGLNQYLSLANKFFDYIHAGVPQVTMDFPEYRAINNQYKVACLIPDLRVETVAAAIERSINDKEFQQTARRNCRQARLEFNWQAEEQKLIQFYKQLLG